MSDLRPVPSSEHTERALLGAILLSNGRALADCGDLRPEHFYIPEHGALFALIAGMRQRKEPIDSVTVPELVGRDPDRYKGIAYVVELADGTPVETEDVDEQPPLYTRAGYYARTIRDLAFAREILAQLEAAREAIYAARWKEFALTPEQLVGAALLSGAEGPGRQVAVDVFRRRWPQPQPPAERKPAERWPRPEPARAK